MAYQPCDETVPLVKTREPKRRTARGVLVVLGGVLLHITFGTNYTFGNMVPYMTSYLRVNGVSDVTYAGSVWIMSVLAVGEGAAFFCGGIIERRLGPRLATLTGCIILCAGVMLTFFTIKTSFATTMVTYGLMFGLGKGVGYILPIACAMRWFPNHMGLVSGFVVAGIGGGAFVFDQIETAYLNPLNEKPRLQFPGESDRYFDQKDILDRVPLCFLLLGGTYAAIQLIGVMLLTNPPSFTYMEEEISANQIQPDARNEISRPINEEDPVDKSRPQEYKPTEMLKTSRFYLLWVILLLIEQALVFVSSLWKAYGQTFIHDDRFLAYVGAFSSVGNGAGRILWGHIGDRYSFKVAFLGLCSSFAALLLTINLTKYGGKPLFFVWIFLIFLSFSGTYGVLPAETSRVFGAKYYSINYGLMLSSSVISGVVGAILPSQLQSIIGWDWMFTGTGAVVTLGLMLIYLYKPVVHNTAVGSQMIPEKDR